MTGISTMLIIEPSFALYSNTWIVPACSYVDRDVELCGEVSPAAGAARRHRERLGDDVALASSTRMFTVASKTSALPLTVTGPGTLMPGRGSATAIGGIEVSSGIAKPGAPRR